MPHQKGIIHRDIKPTNCLVTLNDGRPVPKVIDFGVAKADQPATHGKDAVHGLRSNGGYASLYMSPEQARNDQPRYRYSYRYLFPGRDYYTNCLLARRRLIADGYAKRPTMKCARIIREEEPPRPSTRISTFGRNTHSDRSANRQIDPIEIKATLSGDLDWIVMKSLEKDRTRRYETANGLAMDLSRVFK